MWFAILGPLLVHDGEKKIDVPKGRQRVLLAALMMHTGIPVTADGVRTRWFQSGSATLPRHCWCTLPSPPVKF